MGFYLLLPILFCELLRAILCICVRDYSIFTRRRVSANIYIVIEHFCCKYRYFGQFIESIRVEEMSHQTGIQRMLFFRKFFIRKNS
jgi:hypothetical protein